MPLEDHGLIGDGNTAALVGRDGTIAWLCAPRFDAPPVFARLLDSERGGSFCIAPDKLVGSRQQYDRDTAVLVTRMEGPHGLLELTDACLLRPDADLTRTAAADRGVLQRTLRVLHGRVRVQMSIDPLGGASCERMDGGLRLRMHERRELDLQLASTAPLAGPHTTWDLREGDEAHVWLRWKSVDDVHPQHAHEQEQLEHTRRVWRAWMRHVGYQGPHEELVRRSAITLKLLDYFANGAMIAAPTSSLPEWIGSARNWDYRYVWVRDAAFSVYALRRIGLVNEASSFLEWVLDEAGHAERPRVMYSIDGGGVPKEREDERLEGYRRSPPVRWGNDAADQRQHDVFGEVLDCAYQWVRHGGEIDEPLWRDLCSLAEGASAEWDQPDHGIWEVRTEGAPYTYSAALCHVALHRTARIAEIAGLPGPIDRWRAEADRIRKAILERAWSPERDALTEHLEGGALDASLLTLPLRRVIHASHPRMVATTEAIVRHLSAEGEGLLFRYLPNESPDGVDGEEGAFLLCSFWLVENYAMQGRLDEAHALFDSLCARANPLGLLAEQVEPKTGAFLGNFPQAMSHIGVIASAVRLRRARGE